MKFPNPEEKRSFLKKELCALNKQLPAQVYIPFVNNSMRNHAVLNIVVEDAIIFQTKERAPLLLCLEVYRPNEVALEEPKELLRSPDIAEIAKCQPREESHLKQSQTLVERAQEDRIKDVKNLLNPKKTRSASFHKEGEDLLPFKTLTLSKEMAKKKGKKIISKIKQKGRAIEKEVEMLKVKGKKGGIREVLDLRASNPLHVA